MTSLKIYIDEAMREARKDALEAQAEAKLYRKMHLYNLIRRAKYLEERGEHMEKPTIRSVGMELRELAYAMNVTPESRHRMSKEIAEELLVDKDDKAHFYALEKLANGTNTPQLWRDVLTYLDELGGNDGRGVDKGRDGCGEEH